MRPATTVIRPISQRVSRCAISLDVLDHLWASRVAIPRIDARRKPRTAPALLFGSYRLAIAALGLRTTQDEIDFGLIIDDRTEGSRDYAVLTRCWVSEIQRRLNPRGGMTA